MRRLLALVGAAVMVVGAIAVRGLLDEDDATATGPDGSGSGSGSGSGDDGALRVVCGSDLEAACEALRDAAGDDGIVVRSEDEAVTAQRLADGELVLGDSAVWLAAGPWPDITEAGGTEMPELASSEVLARSPAVIVARDDRMAALEATCGSPDWACIGNGAGGPWTELGGEEAWGRVEVALPSTARGDGTVAVNQAVASRVGRTDFATNDLDDPQVADWFSDLAAESAANAAGTTPMDRFLRVPGSLGVVGASEAEAAAGLARAATAGAVTVVAPEPVVTADVRLWGADDDGVAGALEGIDPERLREALGAAGWRVVTGDGATRPPSAGTIAAEMRSFDTTLPEGDALPDPGVVSTVNRRWEGG